MLPVELTNEDIRNSEAYKEYYAIASGAAPPKTKASVRKTKSSSDTTITPSSAAGTRLSTSAKGKQHAKSFKAKGLTVLSEVAMTKVVQMNLATKRSLQQTHISQASGSDTDNDGNDFVHPKLSIHEEEAKDEESFDPIVQTPKNTNDEEFIGVISICYKHAQPKFDLRLKTLEANFSEFLQTNQFTKAVSSIPRIVERYMDQRMNEAVKTSYAVAGDLSELELKKILIEKMESNKSIHRIDEQRNVYKALVDAYECDKIILDTYGDTVTLKRHHDDADNAEEPSIGSDRVSKRRRERKELESTSAPKGKETKTTGKSTEGSKSHQKTTSESTPAEEPMHTTKDLEEP
nr:hypothetical protein [Tanacetum cinerariifolium]